MLAVAGSVALAGGGGNVGWGWGWSVGSVCSVCSACSVGSRGRQVHVEGLQAVHLREDPLLDIVELQGCVFCLRVGLQEADVKAGEEKVVLGGACAPVGEAGDGRAWNVREQFCYGRIVLWPELRGREIWVHERVVAPIIGVLAAPSAATLWWEDVFVRVRGEIEMRKTSEERRREDAMVGGQEHPVLEDALGLRFIKTLVILLKNTMKAGQHQGSKR